MCVASHHFRTLGIYLSSQKNGEINIDLVLKSLQVDLIHTKYTHAHVHSRTSARKHTQTYTLIHEPNTDPVGKRLKQGDPGININVFIVAKY